MVGQVGVARPVTEVFDRAADEPSWNPAMTSVQWLTPPPLGVGSRYRAVMGGCLSVDVEITEFGRPRRLGSRTSSPWMSTEGAITFTESAAGDTLLRWDWHYRLHGPLRLLGLAFAAVGGRWERKNWERLRDLLEQRQDGIPKLTGATVVVTGANGGLGLQPTQERRSPSRLWVVAGRRRAEGWMGLW